MRVALRADAAQGQGAGHVMRCLTIAEAARRRGHEVVLVSALDSVTWLRRLTDASGIRVVPCVPDAIDVHLIESLGVDWVVVDSYSIPAPSISELNTRVPCLALIDGDDRGIAAHLYVDSNLDAEKRSWPHHIRSRLLAGADFALVREAVLAERRAMPWVIRAPQPHVVAFMGGTDPHNAISMVARALLAISPAPHVTLVVAESSRQETAVLVAGRDGFSVVDATEKLPQIVARADVVVSAAGTSAWDLCALGVPSILIGLVENQSAGLRAAVDRGLVLGWDSHENLDSISRRLGPELERLLSDEELRRELSERSTATFDGRGSTRVVAAMEGKPSHAAPRD